MDAQKEELVQLTLTRKNNDEKIKKERQMLEGKIKIEKIKIQKQTKLSEDIDAQKEELVQVKEERTKIMEKIESQKRLFQKN